MSAERAETNRHRDPEAGGSIASDRDLAWSSEVERVKDVYAGRESKRSLYVPSNADVLMAELLKARGLGRCLGPELLSQIQSLRILDVGCGRGSLLRMFVEWGAAPRLMTGLDVLPDRIQRAAEQSPSTIRWVQGTLDDVPPGESFDLVCAFTIFSSILDVELRRDLARQMWTRLAPGGRIVLFDFRYDNPRNRNVRGVRRREIRDYWPYGVTAHYRPLCLAPPLLRVLAKHASPVCLAVEAFFPPLRSHFMASVTRPAAEISKT